jgi:CRP/FNR family transcriptional regulator, cyclic AMP receptor protein
MYLPRKRVEQFPKRSIIYTPHRPSDSLYAVIQGRVKITTAAEGGRETVCRILHADGLFGESILVGTAPHTETAEAIDAVSAMSWTRDEIEQQIEREPRLGISLTQHFTRTCIELRDRIESIALSKASERVMLALIQLARSLGTPMPDGTVRITALTHVTLAQYIGTSREIVTFEMNRLRRLGMVQYSRQHIDIYTAAIEETLRKKLSAPSG